MKTIVFVMLQVILASGILYGYYHLMLRNKRFHQYNRFYLLASAIISVLIPFLNIPVYFEEAELRSSVVLQTLQTISSSNPENEIITSSAPVSPAVSTPFNWNVVLYILYGFAALLLFVRILISLKKIITIIKNNPFEDLDGVRFINTVEPGTPYSFFRWLFWNKRIELRSEKGEQIFRHEIFHIQQKHSLDIIFMELLTVVFWINPFFHLMKKELKAIHEFLADQFAAHKTEKWEYAELLLMQALNTQQQLVNPFFHNQIKRRIVMITNPKKTSHRYLRKLLVLPVAAIVLILFAFKYKNKTAPDILRSDDPITIVIDAAHGGTDAGAISPDNKYSEAQISLEIARQIQGLAKEYAVNVIMTREDDQFPGNAANKEDGLKKRVEITNKIKPDAFIAIHVNAAYNGPRVNQTKYTGFEAYVSDKREDAKAKLLASAILKNLSPVYKTSLELKQRNDAGVYVLDHNSYPAVLLECGYINNLEDLAFITNKANQEKIARSILETIVKYKKQITGGANLDTGNDTLPRPHSKRGFFYSKPDNLLLETDSIIWVKGPAKTKTNFKKALVILDGQKVNNEILSQKTIISKQITFYSENDPQAIKRYGTEASKGVIVFESAQVINIPPAEFYKEELSKSKGTETDNIVFEKVEIEPAFVGGQESWKKFLERNLNASVAADNKAPAGEYTVYIQFIVHKDGRVSDVKPLTNHGFGMEQEAMRIIKKGPPWTPAIQNGRTVNAYKRQPVNFIAGKDKNQKTTLIEKWLSEIVLVSYVSSNPKPQSVTQGAIKTPSLTEAGSVEWRKFFERNLDSNTPIKEGWTEGSYKILIQFTQNEDGTVSEIKALTNPDSKTAEHCITMVKHIQKLMPQKNDGAGQKIHFVQPFTFQVIPDKSVSTLYKFPKIPASDLKKATVRDLLHIDQEIEIVSFNFGIDNIKNSATEVMNTGSEFNTQTTELIRNAVAGNTIMVDYIRIKKDGREVKLPSLVYEVVD